MTASKEEERRRKRTQQQQAEEESRPKKKAAVEEAAPVEETTLASAARGRGRSMAMQQKDDERRGKAKGNKKTKKSQWDLLQPRKKQQARVWDAKEGEFRNEENEELEGELLDAVAATSAAEVPWLGRQTSEQILSRYAGDAGSDDEGDPLGGALSGEVTMGADAAADYDSDLEREERFGIQEEDDDEPNNLAALQRAALAEMAGQRAAPPTSARTPLPASASEATKAARCLYGRPGRLASLRDPDGVQSGIKSGDYVFTSGQQQSLPPVHSQPTRTKRGGGVAASAGPVEGSWSALDDGLFGSSLRDEDPDAVHDLELLGSGRGRHQVASTRKRYHASAAVGREEERGVAGGARRLHASRLARRSVRRPPSRHRTHPTTTTTTTMSQVPFPQTWS